MANIRNSALLDSILERAEALCRENRCSGLTRDYIIVAALTVLRDKADEQDEEVRKTAHLLENLSGDRESLTPVLEKWRGKEIPGIESMILSTQKGKALKAAESARLSRLPANLYLAEILREETEAMQALHRGAPKSEGRAPEPAPSVPGWMAALRRGKQPDAPSDTRREESEAKRPEPAPEPEKSDMASLIQRTKKLQEVLLRNVHGQNHAVGIFAAGYFQSELQAAIEKNRKRPRATFLFAGPPGVGKTFLSEEAARILELPFRRYDMSEYANASAGDELCGSDANYKASSEGLLTGFVNANPHCVLLIDEIEKANMDVLHLFLQVLDAGRLRDNRTDQEVSFKDAILIFTTNAGKALYSGSDAKNLSTLSRDMILDGLAKDINPRTGEPFFPGALCSRFASGNVVMFNHLDAHTLRSIVDAQLQQHISDLREAMGIEIDMAREVPTAILLSEGASADGRTAKGRTDAFFGGELYELFRLINPENSPVSIDQIKSIRMTVDLERGSDEIRKLFRPDERIHVLAYADAPYQLEGDDALVPVIHCVHKKFIGEGEELVHNIFATARRYAPSVVFIDEIDAVGSARNSGSTTGEFKADLLTALLTEMDGFANDVKKPVFVLAATNFGVKPGDRLQLDEALLRRFDRRILVDLPNLENRKRFLKKMTDAEPIFHISERGIDSIAERSTGMSLALLRSMLDLAIRTAMQKDADRVEDGNLDEAFETFNGGEQRKWSPEITLRTARHEAGHTLVSWLAGEKPSYVTIVSRGNFGGYMQHADQEERFGYTRQELLSRIRTSMGGRAAEIVCYGREDGFSTGASGDLQTATHLAKHMLSKGMISLGKFIEMEQRS